MKRKINAICSSKPMLFANSPPLIQTDCRWWRWQRACQPIQGRFSDEKFGQESRGLGAPALDVGRDQFSV